MSNLVLNGLTIDNIGCILETFEICPFCGNFPKVSGGYNFGKVNCSNDNCKIHNIFFYPNQWNSRA